MQNIITDLLLGMGRGDILIEFIKAVSIMAKRSAQVNVDMKEELMEKLEEFAISQDQLDEVFENKEQIAVSKFYEGLPKPWSIAMKELLNDELYLKQEESNDLDA